MVFFSNFLNNVQNAHGCVTGSPEDGKDKGHRRRKDIDVLRMASQQLAG